MKYFSYILIFILSLDVHAARFSDPNFYRLESIWTSHSGEKFKLCRISSNGALKIVKEKKIKVTFREDKAIVSEIYKKKLNRFFQRLPKNTFSIKIAAHADQCGDPDYNAKLAQRRGLNVYEFIKDKIPKDVKVIGINNGENESSGHIDHDKFVEIIAEYWITDEEFSEIVLFDISGSLHPKKIGHTSTGYTLDGLKQIKLNPGTIAYVPRDIRYACEGQHLNDYNPVGEDFYWEAMTLISTTIKGSIRGLTFTDDTDPRGRLKERNYNQVNTGKVKWEIH